MTKRHTSPSESQHTDSTIDVLHVDPDPHFRDLTAAYLGHLDPEITVHTAPTAADALETADVLDGVDCVISEYRLRHDDGLALLERFRTRQRGIPFVFLTTCEESRTEARAFGAGADAVFRKRCIDGVYDSMAERIRWLVDVASEERRSRRPHPGGTTAPHSRSNVSGFMALSTEE